MNGDSMTVPPSREFPADKHIFINWEERKNTTQKKNKNSKNRGESSKKEKKI